MAKPYDIWCVEVYSRMTRGKPRWLRSKPMTLTDAWFKIAEYERVGHKCRIIALDMLEDEDEAAA